MSNLNITLPNDVCACDGKQITFRAPCNCSAGDSIIIDGITYQLVNADNSNAKVGSYFSGAMVSVILDIVNSRAYIQNGKENISYPLNIDCYTEKLSLYDESQTNLDFSDTSIIDIDVTSDITFTLADIDLAEGYCKSGLLILNTQLNTPSITFPSNVIWTSDFSLGEPWTTTEIIFRKYTHESNWIASLVNSYRNYKSIEFNLSELPIGSEIYLYQSNVGDLIPWIIVDKNHYAEVPTLPDSSGQVVLMQKYPRNSIAWNSPAVSAGLYETSYIDTYLVDTYVNYLPLTVRNALINAPIKATTAETSYYNRSIFLPSLAELGLTTNTYSNWGFRFTYFSSTTSPDDIRGVPERYVIGTSTIANYWVRANASGSQAYEYDRSVGTTSQTTPKYVVPCIQVMGELRLTKPDSTGRYILQV